MQRKPGQDLDPANGHARCHWLPYFAARWMQFRLIGPTGCGGVGNKLTTHGTHKLRTSGLG